MKLSTKDIAAAGGLLCSLTAAVIITAACSAFAEGEKSSADLQVVAEVNGTKITKHQLELEVSRQLEQELGYYNQVQQQELRRKVLARMVERELLLQAGRSAGFVPSAEDLADFMDSLKRSFPNHASFLGELEKHGMDERTFTSGIRDDLTIKNYVQKTLFAGIHVDDAEAKEKFLAEQEVYRQPEEVHVRHILFKVAENAGPEAVSRAEQLAQRVAAEVKSGSVDFGFLAKKYSEAPNSGQGGDLGFVTRNQLDEQFSQAAFLLKDGEISGPVRTKFGFHIIKVEERRGGNVPEYSAVKDKVLAGLVSEKQEKILAGQLKRLEQQGKVIIYFH